MTDAIAAYRAFARDTGITHACVKLRASVCWDDRLDHYRLRPSLSAQLVPVICFAFVYVLFKAIRRRKIRLLKKSDNN